MAREERQTELETYLGHKVSGYVGYDNSFNFSNDEGLRKYYKANEEVSLRVLMLRYDWTPNAEKILSYLEEKEYFVASKKVLDFACGTADYGIVCAEKGYITYICDLKEMLDFAEWRFKERNLPCQRIEVDDNFQSTLPRNLDLVIAAECIEHLRNPMEKLQEIYESLNDGGFFWYPGFPSESSNAKFDHLQEAATQEAVLLEFLKTNFIPVVFKPGYLWKKRVKE